MLETSVEKMMLEVTFSSWALCALFLFSLSLLFTYDSKHNAVIVDKKISHYISVIFMVSALIVLGTSVITYRRRRHLIEDNESMIDSKEKEDSHAFGLKPIIALGLFGVLFLVSLALFLFPS